MCDGGIRGEQVQMPARSMSRTPSAESASAVASAPSRACRHQSRSHHNAHRQRHMSAMREVHASAAGSTAVSRKRKAMVIAAGKRERRSRTSGRGEAARRAARCAACELPAATQRYGGNKKQERDVYGSACSARYARLQINASNENMSSRVGVEAKKCTYVRPAHHRTPSPIRIHHPHE